LGHLFLHEPIGPIHLIGGVLIVSGGLWAARER
jgi:drug/metabolite transporter (DMT)-like permease